MKTKNNSSKAKRNYYIDIAMLLPFLMLLFTGIIMLIYHTGKPYPETSLGLDGESWLKIHVVSAIISFVLVGIHLSLHLTWFKKLFSGQLKNKYWVRNLILVIVFLFTLLTSFIPLLFLGESDAAKMMLGIHNKLGLLLIVFFFIHLLSYFKWLVNMTKKAMIKN
ncbi:MULTISPECIES: DUF4405 domain-containing protein [unclassified Lentimicrobium]|uniref:DUF4405 domain-containing protein n=1 Tax=unclassified Lentimicrobium TaxID=2677434 RepID=UPI001557C7F9|nr:MULTISPECIES: DUF4405 domain-containing protein [unclassified Lentimicrobium]NPD47682.1 DUF4405 domain-containing protein [Lentimicrobium sp. S6]NPD86128.1 DUF4405 domain-containing protein [Lentimicrobium sp. L6]